MSLLVLQVPVSQLCPDRRTVPSPQCTSVPHSEGHCCCLLSLSKTQRCPGGGQWQSCFLESLAHGCLPRPVALPLLQGLAPLLQQGFADWMSPRRGVRCMQGLKPSFAQTGMCLLELSLYPSSFCIPCGNRNGASISLGVMLCYSAHRVSQRFQWDYFPSFHFSFIPCFSYNLGFPGLC